MINNLIEIIGRVSLVVLGGVLWRLGGMKNGRQYRRLGFPAALATVCYLQTADIWASLLTMLIGWAVLSVGYGIPDPGGDGGSAIGAFWYKVTKHLRWSRVLTRLSVGILYACAFIPMLYVNFEVHKLVQALVLPLIVILIVEKEVGPLKEEALIGSSFLGLYLV